MAAVPAVPAPARGRPTLLVIIAVAIPIAIAAAIFAGRVGRPLEQGGDAYSDGNAMLGGRNFVEHGFAKMHFLPVVVPDPTLPTPAKDEYYTHYPPGADLLNGLERTLGLRDVTAWRWVAIVFSLAGLLFWFAALRRLFGDGVAVVGVAAYALNFSFIWLGDAIHHYAVSDFLRSFVLWLGVKHAEDDARPLDTALLALALFLQSLLAYDYIPGTHLLLLMIGATGFHGARLRRLLLFAAMPVLGVGLHLAQNAWALGFGGMVDDMRGAFLERAFAAGTGDFPRFTPLSLLRSVLRDTQQLMGVGLGTLAGFAAFGVAAHAVTAPESERGRAARITAAIGASAALWFVLMHQHAGEHPYSDRQLLPFASLALALGLAGLWSLAARWSRRGAVVLAVLASLGLIADGSFGYMNDAQRRTLTSRSFDVAYARRGDLPAGVTVASNIPAPAPPMLEVVLNRRAKKVRNLVELHTEFPAGSNVVFLYSPDAPIDRPLLEFLHTGRILKMDDHGVAVAITVPAEESSSP